MTQGQLLDDFLLKFCLVGFNGKPVLVGAGSPVPCLNVLQAGGSGIESVAAAPVSTSWIGHLDQHKKRSPSVPLLLH